MVHTYSAPQQCPTCGNALEVRELGCPVCGTSVHGTWAAGPFSRLTAEQTTFLTLFVRSRGNLSDVERTLGVSYPTVRAKLEEIIAALDEPAPTAPAAPTSGSGSRAEILQRVARGEITVDEGMAQIRQLPRGSD